MKIKLIVKVYCIVYQQNNNYQYDYGTHYGETYDYE
jgi:hypothetical protein